MSEIENLRRAIMAIEGQRAALGHEVAEAALAPLRVKLAELETDEFYSLNRQILQGAEEEPKPPRSRRRGMR